MDRMKNERKLQIKRRTVHEEEFEKRAVHPFHSGYR